MRRWVSSVGPEEKRCYASDQVQALRDQSDLQQSGIPAQWPKEALIRPAEGTFAPWTQKGNPQWPQLVHWCLAAAPHADDFMSAEVRQVSLAPRILMCAFVLHSLRLSCAGDSSEPGSQGTPCPTSAILKAAASSSGARIIVVETAAL
jgi:hypothetical protein